MNSSSREARSSIDEATDAAGKVAGKISDGLDEAARSASRFSERLRSKGALLQDELSAAGERFGGGAKRLGDVAAEQIRAHPIAAFGIAVALGFVATRVLRRR